jgi:lauroyl/myristoyl acyltransferase
MKQRKSDLIKAIIKAMKQKKIVYFFDEQKVQMNPGWRRLAVGALIHITW